MRPSMDPPPGTQRVAHVGDRLRVTLQAEGEGAAFLRTNLTRGARARREVLAAGGLMDQDALTFAGASWRDIPMARDGVGWVADLPLTEVGHFRAKAYLRDPGGRQSWPEGDDLGLSVLPDRLRCGNVVYCAFPRLFGRPTPATDSERDAEARLAASGWTVLSPTGKLRDLTAALPHIFDTLGCRILHLLPVTPTPTTYARMGRLGSPYAALDLTALDPALITFDGRSTGEEQFQELADGVHARGGLLIVDLVAHHSGWESRIMARRPGWVRRKPDGRFVSPGAWGTVWEDLVELEDHLPAYWRELAEALLVWCGRGVDGFRCDAGYMVPLAAWQAVQARVREAYPDTVFLLEGLGGAWSATEALLAEGGMQWAYSELFQEFTGPQVSGYLDHVLQQSGRLGPLVHYAETHDNLRLAGKGRAWSLLRHRLCALTSVNGAFGTTCGAEWLATARIDVHDRTDLAWAAEPNLIPELAALARLLTEHPCFFDGARLRRLSEPGAPVLALERVSADGLDRCLALVNLDLDGFGAWPVPAPAAAWVRSLRLDLLDQEPPAWADDFTLILAPGAAFCLAAEALPKGLHGAAYREARARAAWASQRAAEALPAEVLGPCDWRALAARVDADPAAFLAALDRIAPERAQADFLAALDEALADEAYSAVVRWRREDASRELPWPPGHWLLVEDPHPFQASLGEDPVVWQAQGLRVAGGYVAALPPTLAPAADRLRFRPQDGQGTVLTARLHHLPADPPAPAPDPDGLVLLTNGRGAMVRLQGDLGAVASKYDALLAANLDPGGPCDRHVLAKRVRAWINADGFLTPLDGTNLVALSAGPPATWTFRAHAGDGRQVGVVLTVAMALERNAVALAWARTDEGRAIPATLSLRVDLEDRSFHGETTHADDLDRAWQAVTTPLPEAAGFRFQPAPDRGLSVQVTGGVYHPAPEWSRDLPHPVEAERGLRDRGDAWSPGWFELPLGDGPATLALDADGTGTAAPAPPEAEEPSFEARLRKGLQAYLVRRGDGLTVVAGYPWFLDWGRDAAIFARGLVAAGEAEAALSVLRTLAAEERAGSLPNRLGAGGDRVTSDAPLWFALACEEAMARFGTDPFAVPVGARSLGQVLLDLAEAHLGVTAAGVRLDPASGLLWSPARHTWMDTGYPACTPREGYPIELQGLWIRLLRWAAELAPADQRTRWTELALQAEASLGRFWCEAEGWSADVLEGPAGTSAAEAQLDRRLRPNQLLLVTLGLVPLPRARRMVDAATRHLVVPGALRSLAPLPGPGHPYAGRYLGDEDTSRKPAYHNGTAWVWWLPLYAEALAAAWPGDARARAAARAHVAGLAPLLDRGCLGHLPELRDGDAPHTPRGCDAQAWSLSETLRVWLPLATEASP